jgi:hypothetical protein
MVAGLAGLVVGLILGILGAIVGSRFARGSNWRFVTILVGFVVGAALGVLAGAGGLLIWYSAHLP